MLASDLLSAADPVAFARSRLAFTPDPVQASVLRSRHPRRLLNCSRQWGKSTTTAVLAVHHLLYGPPANLTLIVAPTLRQSSELLRKCSAFLRRLRLRPRRESGNPHSLVLANGSRILALPGRADTIRCFSAVSLLILDEAARISDDLYVSVRPMVAASGGSIVALSTPAGQRGFFYQASLDDSWERYVIPATECSRLPDAFLDEERRSICEWWFRQEYLCRVRSAERRPVRTPPPRASPHPRHGGFMTNTPLFYCGLDLGKLQDYTAFVVVEYRHAYLGRDAVTFQHLYDWDLRVRRLHRFPLGTSYRDLIGLIEHEMSHRALPRDTPLVIDASGVGEVMVDLFKGSAFPVVPVTITGGDRASQSNGRWYVPRRLLAETLAVLIEKEKLGVVADLPYARTLLEELASFDAEIRPTARVSFRPRGNQQHDDLVMALALACWYFRKLNPPSTSPQTFSLPFY